MTNIATAASPADLFSADEWTETDGYLRQFLATAARYVFPGHSAAPESTGRDAELDTRNTEK